MYNTAVCFTGGYATPPEGNGAKKKKFFSSLPHMPLPLEGPGPEK